MPYAMARDGLFFRVTGMVHPKFRTPGGALIFQGVLAGLMALTGTFEELTSLFVFAAWIFYALSVVAMFRLRRIAPDLPRPYRTWGYPVVPALFVAGALGAYGEHLDRTAGAIVHRTCADSFGPIFLPALEKADSRSEVKLVAKPRFFKIDRSN